jgi:hypothetical protein
MPLTAQLRLWCNNNKKEGAEHRLHRRVGNVVGGLDRFRCPPPFIFLFAFSLGCHLVSFRCARLPSAPHRFHGRLTLDSPDVSSATLILSLSLIYIRMGFNEVDPATHHILSFDFFFNDYSSHNVRISELHLLELCAPNDGLRLPFLILPSITISSHLFTPTRSTPVLLVSFLPTSTTF